MKRQYLGDSYDVVKRLWQETLSEWAPLYAEPRFIPAELRPDFTLITHIPILGDDPPRAYSILNDPNTGVRLPSRPDQSEGRSHIALSTICKQLSNPAVRCV